MNHNMKEKALSPLYEYSQRDVAQRLFLAPGTVAEIEKRAMEKFKKGLAERGIKIEDLI